MSKKIQQSAILVKKKGRARTPTSLLLFELDDKNVDCLLGDNKAKIFKDLYAKMRAGCKILFVSKQDPVIQRLQQEITFNVEIQLLKDRNQEKMKEEIIKLVHQHLTEKIKPESSVYVGTLFDQKEVSHQSFKFGTVTTPPIYFGSLVNTKSSQQLDDQVPSTMSPDKTEDADFDHKELNYSYESKPSSVKYHPFDEMDSSNSSGEKKFLLLNGESHEQNNQQQDSLSPDKRSLGNDFQKLLPFKINHSRKELPVLYYSKIKDLNNRISCKLCQKLDQLKDKSSLSDNERDIKSPRSLPASPVPEAEDSTSQLGKRKRNFEEDMFNEYVTNFATEARLVDDGIFGTSSQMKDPLDLMAKIKNINFEVDNELDSRPIMKKLKTTETKAENQNTDQASGANDVLLEYKASIPGERPTTLLVYRHDVQKLEPNCFVNDTIIQLYLKLVQSEFLEDSRKSSIYIYNTYLIEKLKASTKEKGTMEEQDFEKAYNSIKKWTKDVDIFEKEFLLFPMHDKAQMHWSLFIVCFPEYLLVKNEGMTDEDRTTVTKPFMLYFDSLKMMDVETAKLIPLYLEYEVMHKKPELYAEIKDSLNRITEDRIFQMIVPLQDNFTDCGLYLLEYAERFMTHPYEILENIGSNRDKLNLFPKSIFKSKRSDIMNLILGLAKGNKDILQEYLRNKEQRLELAKSDPDEFEEIGEEELEDFLRREFNINLNEFQALTRDRLKLMCFLQIHEQKLVTPVGNSTKM